MVVMEVDCGCDDGGWVVVMEVGCGCDENRRRTMVMLLTTPSCANEFTYLCRNCFCTNK